MAGFARFKSLPKGNEPNSFVLEWTSQSNTRIDRFELMWREENGVWETLNISSIKENDYNWAGKHALSGLSKATRFEAKVRAENAEGWSRLSDAYHFATFGAGKFTTLDLHYFKNDVKRFLSTISVALL